MGFSNAFVGNASDVVSTLAGVKLFVSLADAASGVMESFPKSLRDSAGASSKKVAISVENLRVAKKLYYANLFRYKSVTKEYAEKHMQYLTLEQVRQIKGYCLDIKAKNYFSTVPSDKAQAVLDQAMLLTRNDEEREHIMDYVLQDKATEAYVNLNADLRQYLVAYLRVHLGLDDNEVKSEKCDRLQL